MKRLAFSSTGWVLPSMVSVPFTLATLPPSKLKPVARNRAVGWLATSKKSLLRRC